MATSHLKRFLDITELQTNPNYVSNLLKTVYSKNITIEEWNMFVLQFESLISRNTDAYAGFGAVLKDFEEFKIQSDAELERIAAVIGYPNETLSTGFDTIIASLNAAVRFIEDTDASKLTGRVETLEMQVAALSDKTLAFTFTSITPEIVEMGTVVPSVAVKWTLNKTPQRLYVNGVEVAPTSTAKVVVGPFTNDTNFTIKATFEKGETALRTVTLRFLRSVYFGAAAKPVKYSSEFVRGLTANLRADRKKTFDVNAGAGQYIYFCSPVAYGECAFDIDGFGGGFELAQMMDVTNARGHLETYYIYKSDWPNLGKCTVEVS